MDSKQIIVLNVRGFKYEILIDSLSIHPDTRLGKLRTQIRNINFAEISLLCDRFNAELNEFYFDRDPFVLNMILNYYRTKKLHFNHTECFVFLRDELEYWQIDYHDFHSCCLVIYYDKMEHSEELLKIEKAVIKNMNNVENFGKRFYPDLR